MRFEFCLIDAFTSRPFAGNPAAVVRLAADSKVADAELQAIAMEFNQAETAFIRPRSEGRWDLRWFTPIREVPLCGHATLAAAHALVGAWKLADAAGPIRFVTRESGELICTRIGDRIVMDFPTTPPTATALPANAAAVLGVPGPVVCVGSTAMNLTLALSDEAQIRAAKPDFAALSRWHATGVTIARG